MKILQTSSYIGAGLGQPMKQGSIEHLQSSYTEALVAVSKSLQYISYNGAYSTSTPYALYGFNPTSGGSPTMYNIPESWIFYNGVLYHAPSASLSYPLSPGTDYIGVISTSYTTSAIADPVTMSDGTTTDNVHADFFIRWIIGSTGSGTFSSSSVSILPSIQNTLSPILTDRINAGLILGVSSSIVDATTAFRASLGAWIAFGTGGSSISTGWSASTLHPRFTTDGVGRIRLSGGLLCPTASSLTGTSICTLPSVYRPPLVTMRFIANAVLASTHVPIYIEIDTSGVVSWVNASIADGDTIFLDNINFLNS